MNHYADAVQHYHCTTPTNISTIKPLLFIWQVIATCICLSLSAYVTLALHFLPKLYIIVFQVNRELRKMDMTI